MASLLLVETEKYPCVRGFANAVYMVVQVRISFTLTPTRRGAFKTIAGRLIAGSMSDRYYSAVGRVKSASREFYIHIAGLL